MPKVSNENGCKLKKKKKEKKKDTGKRQKGLGESPDFCSVHLQRQPTPAHIVNEDFVCSHLLQATESLHLEESPGHICLIVIEQFQYEDYICISRVHS